MMQDLMMAAHKPKIERRTADYYARVAAKQNGAEERKAAAEAKRLRRQARRAHDAA